MYYVRGGSVRTEVKLKCLLDDAFQRRNKIVHQSDRDHKSGQRFDINFEEVNKFIIEIKRFIDTLNIILQES
jgi:hypothetical protein